MPNNLSMTPRESLLLGYDFTAQLASGETIVTNNANGTTEVTALDDYGEAATNLVESGSVAIYGNVLQCRVENPAANTDYTVRFIAATSADNVLEESLSISAGS